MNFDILATTEPNPTNNNIKQNSSTLPSLEFSEAVNLGVPEWRESVEKNIDTSISKGISVRDTIYMRSDAIDQLLIQLFEYLQLHTEDIALFAVGGYGRREMLPYSDVDIMLLTETKLTESQADKIQNFVTKLWDIGLDAGVSVRTLEDCINEVSDVTVATCLLESRLLTGYKDLSKAPKQIVLQAWTYTDFYHAKDAEQKERFKKHNSTEYNLEPDIKNAPGGLRDIHYIGWVCKCYFRINKLSDLVHQSFMTDREYEELEKAEDFLLTLRHHLHRVAGRGENKLLFDYQRAVAKRMGYEDNIAPNSHANASIEAMMRVYYRKAMRISTLNEMLNAYYYESLIEPKLPEKPEERILNDRFKIKNSAIAVRHSKVFTQNPSALLEIFVLMGNATVKNIRAKTLRLLKAHAHLIDAEFREQAENKALFMTIIAERNLLFQRLRKMKRYGILGRYLPAFEKVTGLMQYDLFHRYTVDAHTLLLTRILHRLTDEKYAENFQTVGSIYERMERKDLIHLAALFHDIAKGRGGDHSELGAVDAYYFCQSHGLPEKDCNLVAWLVESHLLMSVTAQKRDISDPDVVRMFAEKVRNMVYLNHLYVLTVIDMNATNPELWNTWRASLMQQLYRGARRMLNVGLDTPINKEEIIQKTKSRALTLIKKQHPDIAEVETIWEELTDEYFIREADEDIVWHTLEILKYHKTLQEDVDNDALILVREHNELALDAVEVFIYAKDKPNLFACTVSVFNRMDLDVQDARIITAARDFALDTYVLIDRHGTLLKDENREQMLVDAIQDSLKDNCSPKITHQRMPRRLKHFNIPTRITLSKNEHNDFHNLVINTLDQPGLLAIIACVFFRHDIEVHSARITTLGETAEDIFVISDHEDNTLTETVLNDLKIELQKMLDEPQNRPALCS